MKKTSTSILSTNFTVCFSIYTATVGEIQLALNGKYQPNMIQIGIIMDLKDEHYVETLRFNALDGFIFKELVLSTAAEIPSWRTICVAIETKTFHFVIAVENQVKLNFALPSLSHEFPEKVSDLIEGPTMGFMGKITYINVHDNLKRPENIECGAPGSILKWNFLDWNVDQLYIRPPKPNNIKNIFLDLTPAFTLCFEIFIIGENFFEMNIHQGNQSGLILYQSKNIEFNSWEEYLSFNGQENMLSKLSVVYFQQWRNICVRVDTVLGETNVTIDKKLVLNNYVVKDLVNTTTKLPKSSIDVLKSMKWKYPGDLKNVNLYSKFQDDYSSIKGDIYKWNIRDWTLDETLKTLVKKTLVKKDEICGKNVFIINSHKVPFTSAEKTCQLIGKLSSSIRDLARTKTDYYSVTSKYFKFTFYL